MILPGTAILTVHFRPSRGVNSADGFDVCNPLWARLGAVPRLQFKGAYDGNVWIKHPGESDGDRNDDQQNCHGGPASGQWWPQGARRLMAS